MSGKAGHCRRGASLMTGKITSTLAGLLLTVAASGAMAQPAEYGAEYRWLTLFGEAEYPLPASQPPVARPGNFLETLLRRAFVTLQSDYRPSDASREFRGPDPEFGNPAAFRRPRQTRLGFSIRF